ncbi:MAG TPA: TaqI-like C-terminal specificity domain-containing protein, partial [Allocoleopsis sp.]
DLFCVFIEQALNLCRDGGFSSLVVPNKLASAHYADRTRQFLTQQHTLHYIRDYSSLPVFDASVYPLVYVAEKTPPASQAYQVPYHVMQTLEQVKQTRSLTLTHPRQPWISTCSDQQTQLLHRLQQDFPPLATLTRITGAATVGEAYAWQPLIQECPTPASGDLLMVNSGTIDRYGFLWGQKTMRYLGQRYQHPIVPLDQVTSLPAKRQQQAQQPKIIVAGMSQRLEAALDRTGGVLAGKSTSIIWLNPITGLDLRYLLALLNSRLLSFFFMHWFQGNRLQGGYFRIGPPQLRQLPCYLPDLNHPDQRQDYDRLITLIDHALMQFPCQFPCVVDSKPDVDSNHELDREIDRIVYRLYGLTSEEIRAIEE